jgi:hypothetical protein
MKVAQNMPAILKEDDLPSILKEEPSTYIGDIDKPADEPGMGSGTGKKAPAEEQSPYYSPSFSAVKDMQQAIVNFAATLSAHPVMSMKGLDTGEANGTQTRDRTNGKDFLGGSLPFANFLVSQYVNNSDVVGEEFVNVDVPEPVRSQASSPNVNLKSVVNTIGIVGSAGSQNKPDGIWQNRTNNALRQIYAVGAGLFRFARDMGITIKGYTEEQLNDFKNLIPKSYTDIKDAANLAKQITPYITALGALYKQFESAVLEQPQLKELIEQNKPLVDHSGQAVVKLTADEQKMVDTNRAANIPGAVVNGKAVRLADIEGPVAFTNFLKSANVDVSKPSEVQKQLASIRTMIAEEGPGF